MSGPPKRVCPICRRPVVETRYRPFCSRRCADIDLGRWLGGDYRIPSEDEGEGEEETGGESDGSA
ncbi:MAG: DNA gyrase inhibitor YacG [Alphaproteobacteria bacterium]